MFGFILLYNLVIHMHNIVLSDQKVDFRGCAICVWTRQRELYCIIIAITN